MMQSRIHIKVQAVVSVLDDFTGKPVETGLLRMEMPDGTRVISKSGGCFVITDCPFRQMEFDVISPIYETAHLCIDLDAVERTCPMISVRMIPGGCYPMPEGITSIEGYAAPGETIMAICTEPATSIRLLLDYDRKKDRESIRLYHMSGEALEGRLLAVMMDKNMSESIEILKKEQEEGLYRLNKPLMKNYKKTEVYLCRIHRGRTAENGYFRIPLAQVPAKGCECICLVENSKGTADWSGPIQCGIRNIIKRTGGC